MKNKNKWIIVLAVVLLSVVLSVQFTACFLLGANASNDWIYSTIKRQYYYELADEDIRDAVQNDTLSQLLDIYSAYYTAEQYQSVNNSNAGNKSGVGITFSYYPASNGGQGGILIHSVLGNSPAFHGGLKGGTLLVSGSVGERSCTFTSSQSFSDFLGATPDDTDICLTDALGTTYTVQKRNYMASYVTFATAKTYWYFADNATGTLSAYENKTKAYSFLPEGFGYISLSQFFGGAADQMGVAIQKFCAESCTSLVLDLRSNGGGYVDCMQDMAGYFTANVTEASTIAMTAIYKDGTREEYPVKQKIDASVCLPKDTQVYVLANGDTASASEALIGVLVSCGLLPYEHIYLSEYGQEYQAHLSSIGAQVKSARTYGKGIMQSTFVNVFTHEALKLTTAKIYWPNGNCIHDVGLTVAEGCKTVPTDWIVTQGDGELRAAISAIYASQTQA